MKLTRFIIWPLIVSSLLMITACGGGGGGGSIGSGEVSMSITDAKPLLPEGANQATNLTVTFTDILVHKSGGGWTSLPLTGDLPSTTIDLLQFYGENTTEIVPPVLLEYGKYTQIRIVVSEARISFDDGLNWDPVVIPSENLKTDKNFTFDPIDPAAADIIIDFDLSQSLVVTDPFGTPSYKLKPVLHIVRASEAATITGVIADQSFINYSTDEASITVFANSEVYTEITVERNPVPAEFTIFWLVPEQDYTVEIDMNPADEDGAEWSQTVSGDDLEPGEEKDLGTILITNPPT
jgi:hypothetical protein